MKCAFAEGNLIEKANAKMTKRKLSITKSRYTNEQLGLEKYHFVLLNDTVQYKQKPQSSFAGYSAQVKRGIGM